MAAPAFGTAGTYLVAGDVTSAAVPVPASVASGDIILVGIYKESTVTIIPPAGFTQVTNSPVATTGSVSQLSVWWKRASAADTGTYTFSWTPSTYCEATSIRVTGGLSSGTPTEVNNFAQVSTATTASPAVSGTTADVDRLLVWFGTNFDGGGQVTAPSGFTGRDGRTSGATPGTIAVATKTQSAAGATGSVTGTWNVSSVLNAGLVAILPDTGGGGGAVGETVRPRMFAPGLYAPGGLLLPPPRGAATVLPNTIPSAESPGGSGTANNTLASVAAAGGNAAGTGAANNATVNTTGSTNAAAGNAAGTGAANAATVAISTTAGNAAGSGAASAPTPNPGPAAGNAAGTGSAGSATGAVSASAGNAAGTGAARDAAGSIVGPPPDVNQAGFASAPMFYAPSLAALQLTGDTTPALAGSTNVTAGVASGTGAANQPTVSVSTAAGNAAGTGSAGAPTPSVSLSAGNATGTGAANNATVSAANTTNAAAGNAAGTGAASTASTTTTSNAPAGVAAGTGAASNASVNTTGSTNAQAGVATGTGSAKDAALSSAASATAGRATGTGAANAAVPNVGVAAGLGQGTGVARQPTISVSGNISVAAGLAAGTGLAGTAALGLTFPAGIAGGTGAAYNATVTRTVRALAGVASGVGSAHNTTNGVPVVSYPIRAGALIDSANRNTARAVTDEAIHYRAGAPS